MIQAFGKRPGQYKIDATGNVVILHGVAQFDRDRVNVATVLRPGKTKPIGTIVTTYTEPLKGYIDYSPSWNDDGPCDSMRRWFDGNATNNAAVAYALHDIDRAAAFQN